MNQLRFQQILNSREGVNHPGQFIAKVVSKSNEPYVPEEGPARFICNTNLYAPDQEAYAAQLIEEYGGDIESMSEEELQNVLNACQLTFNVLIDDETGEIRGFNPMPGEYVKVQIGHVVSEAQGGKKVLRVTGVSPQETQSGNRGGLSRLFSKKQSTPAEGAEVEEFSDNA